MSAHIVKFRKSRVFESAYSSTGLPILLILNRNDQFMRMQYILAYL